MASTARAGRRRIWYVDVFAGPWQVADEDAKDSSIAIGLAALNEALESWRQKGATVDASAVFVEKNAKSYRRLVEVTRQHAGDVQVNALEGEFAERAPEIARQLGDDAAFVFVDPTGWKGIAMTAIAPLAAVRWRDVLINVMFDHVNRFKDDPRGFIREQMHELFGLDEGELEPGLSEDELFTLYRRQLKLKCRLQYAANVAIPDPLSERTKFHLVLGVNSPVGLELLRRTEAKVSAGFGFARADARRAPGQLDLSLGDQRVDPWFERMRTASEERARSSLREAASASRRIGDVWPEILEAEHLSLARLRELIREMDAAGEIGLVGRHRGETRGLDHQRLVPSKR